MYLAEGEIKREMQLRVEILVGPIATKNDPSEYMSESDNFSFPHCDCLPITTPTNGISRHGF